jgi:hypothetical protein
LCADRNASAFRVRGLEAPEHVFFSRRKRRGGAQPEDERRRIREARERLLSCAQEKPAYAGFYMKRKRRKI